MIEWEYQLRISLNENYAKKIRNLESNNKINKLLDLLNNFDARLVCQFDAFSEYVSEAEKNGIDSYPLYKWTKATIDDENKKNKYLKSFTIYINNQHIYQKDVADKLERKLLELKMEDSNIINIFKYDTNPNNNPQVPDQYK
ncbi:MAG: hypothetical protein CFH01_01333 [Alphaproteobacteria bacterium MarineAlpha2_Bin1]|nr:MAG: hypothetical protein CFH01_01333 [Alphaproteobacteria bacterium MarineAlpha2_Bin1]|tara:strand:+ start:85 stop:510 length:426 start_codon:yes stop_codon:yes gene_type:complete